MSVVASALIPTDTLAAKDDLWQPPAIFLPDWSVGVVLNTAWATDIATVMTAAETRTAAASKPSRSIQFTAIAMGVSEIALMQSCIRRNAMARTPVPLYCDQSPLTAAAAAADTVIACDTASRRFFPGARVVICDLPATTLCTSFEFAVISAVADGAITLAAGLAGAHAVGSLVFPVMEADLVPQLLTSLVTDEKATVQMVFRETVGAACLDPILAPGAAPAGVVTYQDYPVLVVDPDFGGNGGYAATTYGVQTGVNRPNETTTSGRFNYTEVHGSRFKASIAIPGLFLDRASAWGQLGFFDGRGGQQKAFLAVNPASDFTLYIPPPPEPIVSPFTATTVALVAVGSSLDWSWRTHLGIALADGSVVVRAIASVSRADGVDTVTVADAWPDFSAPVIRVSSAFLVRFDSDEVTETWISDQHVAVPVTMAEVLLEASLDAGIPDITSGGDGGSGGGCVCSNASLPSSLHLDLSNLRLACCHDPYADGGGASQTIDVILSDTDCTYVPASDTASVYVPITTGGVERMSASAPSWDNDKCCWQILFYDSGQADPGVTWAFLGGNDPADPTGTYNVDNSFSDNCDCAAGYCCHGMSGEILVTGEP